MAPSTAKKLGQYFTISDRLQQYVFDHVQNRGSTLLEPSFGAGHLLQKFLAADPNYPIVGYEIDSSIKPVVTFAPNQTISYSDFTAAAATAKFKTIIGNPPYVKRPKTYNLYIKFIEDCFDLLDGAGSELIFIVPSDFIKLTSASKIIEKMTAAGAFTHFLFPHDEKLFKDASIDVLVFRYELGPEAVQTIPYNVTNGIITFTSVSTTTGSSTIGDLFDVYVGIVSGKDEIYKNEHGNIEVLTDLERTEKFIYVKEFPSNDDQINSYLLEHKSTLLARRIRKFGETNWWQWGAPRNIKIMEGDCHGQPCIYIRTMTRSVTVASVGTLSYFGGSLLCLFPKSRETDLDAVVAYINSSDFQADYKYAGRFKISHKQICNAAVTL